MIVAQPHRGLRRLADGSPVVAGWRFLGKAYRTYCRHQGIRKQRIQERLLHWGLFVVDRAGVLLRHDIPGVHGKRRKAHRQTILEPLYYN